MQTHDVSATNVFILSWKRAVAACPTGDVTVSLQLPPAHISVIEYCLGPAVPLNVLSVLVIPHRAACARLPGKLSAHYRATRLTLTPFPLPLQSNNYVTIPPFGPITIQPGITFTADAADQVQLKAQGHFKTTAFTSYIELRPDVSALLLVIRRRDEVLGGAINSPTFTGPVTTEASQQMPLTMQLFTSPDYRSPLDPSTKVQSDRRIYAEVSKPVSQ